MPSAYASRACSARRLAADLNAFLDQILQPQFSCVSTGIVAVQKNAYAPKRSEAFARLGSLEREAVIFGLHSDYPRVIVPMEPLTAVWTAANRYAEDGNTMVAPGERIRVDQALRAVTIDAAYVLGMEDRAGSLEPGRFADFAILE